MGALTGAVLGQTANHLVSAGFSALSTTTEITFHGLQGKLERSSNRFIIAVLHQLEAMDIDARLQTVGSLVNSLEGEMDGDATFRLALDHVKEAVPPIKEVLVRIQHELQDHEHRYFATYRAPYTDELVASLERKLKVLDQRVDVLLKVSNMRALKRSV